MKTAITEMFGIRYPVMNAGMGRVALPKLVAAVSNAGGLGVLGCGSGAPEVTRKYIQQIRALTDKPFAGNAPLALPNGKGPFPAVVLVHDGARPVASHALFRSVVDAVLAGVDVAVPVLPLVDTVTDGHGVTVDRDALRAVQTPQGFDADVLRRVHQGRPEATDDASLVVAAGGRLRQVSGERWNLKVTEPSDLHVAETILGTR